MATRILLTNLADFVEETLLEIRNGVRAAVEAGLQAELPKEASFQLEVIKNVQVLELETVTEISDSTEDGARTTTTTNGASVDVTTETGNTVRTTTGSTTSTTTRNAQQQQTEGGSNSSTTDDTYEEFAD